MWLTLTQRCLIPYLVFTTGMGFAAMVDGFMDPLYNGWRLSDHYLLIRPFYRIRNGITEGVRGVIIGLEIPPLIVYHFVIRKLVK